MSNGIYISLSGQIAMVERLDTVARNLAHITTSGYRAEEVQFSTTKVRTNSDAMAFTAVGARTLALESGPLEKTGNPLDIAVKGKGWLSVSTPNGQVYSRDGRLQLDATGALLTVTGFPVLDAAGAPITLNPQGPGPIIAADGTIRQAGQDAGTIGLFTLPADSKLSRGPGSTIVSDRPGTPVLSFATDGIVQGFTEGSNVNPIEQLTKLIAIQRTFEMISGNLDVVNSAKLEAIKALGPAA